MALHAFVAMPYGTKEGIDFNRIYSEYIKPALESAGFEVFRADEESRAGSIHTDMFQELLLADLVVVDLSIDNPNVWYELGVRHALRARGVLQIQCRRDYLPFDVHGQRTLRYHIKDGVPDAEYQPRGRPLTGQGSVSSIAFSPDGKTLASGGGNNTVLWDVEPASWAERACRISNRNLTEEEWRQYLGDEPYRKTCPNLPGLGEVK